MTQEEKAEILISAKEWFKGVGIAHLKNALKVKTIKKFKYNPFLIGYLTYFHADNIDPRSIAKTLIYPRVLGTSINTTFGDAIQSFTHSVLKAFASIVPDMDIEFIDQRPEQEGIRRYAQLKAGPETINGKDVQPMINAFDSTIALAKQNRAKINNNNLVVCVVYGDRASLNGHYKKIQKRYDVMVGQEFWYAVTGDENFYYDLINACDEVSFEMKGNAVFERIIDKLASDPEVIALSEKLMAIQVKTRASSNPEVAKAVENLLG